MKLKEIEFVPQAGVVFDDGDLALLMEWSKRHYDGTCRAAGALGGFLYGIVQYENCCPKAMHTLTFRQVDTLAKIAEGSFGLDPDDRGPKISDMLSYVMSKLIHSTPKPLVFTE